MSAIVSTFRTLNLCSEVATVAGVKEITVPAEAEAVRFSFWASSIANDIWYEVYSIGGPETNHRTLLLRSPTMTTMSEPDVRVLEGGSKFFIKIYHSGAATFEMSGTGVTGILIDRPVRAMITGETVRAVDYYSRSIDAMEELNDNMRRMLNHLRLITGIEEDTAEDF